MKLNQKQRDHLADGLKAAALGQLAFFGYTAFHSGKYAVLVGSVVVLLLLETSAVFMLRKEEKPVPKEKPDA